MRYKKDIKKLLIRLCIFFILIFSIILILSGTYLLPSNSILRIGTNEFIIHFDPYKYNKTKTLSLNQHIFESLVSIDNTGKIKPLLAENWFNIDDKTWIFNIRKNVYFSNGDHLTADDVIYSFERVRIDINSEINSNFDINLAISKIEKINDYRIKIVTETIFPTLLLKLRNCSILPKNYIEKNGLEHFLNNPVGTGPYMNPIITKTYDGKIIRLIRNERYWGKKPYFKVVEFYLFTESKIQELLKNGYLDLIAWYDPDFYLNFQNSSKYKKLSISGLRTTFLILNCLDNKNDFISLPYNPLANYLVRKAIYLSLNIDEIVNKVLLENATSANQIVSPSVIGYNPRISKDTQNIELAKKLLIQANISKGFSLGIQISTNDNIFEKIAYILRQQLKVVNIDLNIMKFEGKELSKIRKEQKFSIIPYSLSSGTGDALFIISTLVHSKDGSWGSYNFSGFSDEEIDKLIEMASEEFDEQKRIEFYQKIMSLTMDKVPYIPLYWPNVVALCKKELKWQIRADERVYAFEMSY